MTRIRALALTGIALLLASCGDYPDPVAACNGEALARAPEYRAGAGPHPIRIYTRNDAGQPFDAGQAPDLSDTLFGGLGSDNDANIELVACITATPTQPVTTCGYGYESLPLDAQGIEFDPTAEALAAGIATATLEYHSANFEVSLRTVRGGEELAHQTLEVDMVEQECPPQMAFPDGQSLMIVTPPVADSQAIYNMLAPYIEP